jgi:hypothetical protein
MRKLIALGALAILAMLVKIADNSAKHAKA